MFFYESCGLLIRSEIEIPFLNSTKESNQPSVAISVGQEKIKDSLFKKSRTVISDKKVFTIS